MRRDDRGDLDVAAITLAWLGWHRLQWGGADPGGRHYPGALGNRVTQWIPRPAHRPVEEDGRTGRHVPVIERQYVAMCKLGEVLERSGVMF